MKAMITGVAGALGSLLADLLLQKGYEVWGNDIKSPEDALRGGLTTGGVKYLWKATEELTIKDIEDAELVISCSATADRPMGISSPIHTLYNNTIPLIHLLGLCREVRPLKIIQPGSGTIYAGETELPVTEKTSPIPKNIYSVSKYTQDMICLACYYAYDLPCIILRSGMVYGGGRLAIAPHRFTIQALKGEPITVFGGKQTRTPTHIRDVLAYWSKIIDLPPENLVGRVLHTVYPVDMAQKGEYTVFEIAQAVLKVTGSKSQIVLQDYEPGERNKGEPAREWIISLSAKELGVTPKIDLVTGLELTRGWIENIL